MGTAPIVELARAYGLHPRLWLLNLWNYETYETMIPWNLKTHETAEPMKPMAHAYITNPTY